MLPSYKIEGFEANIIPDSNFDNEFYTIKKKPEKPISVFCLHDHLFEFMSKDVFAELSQFNPLNEPKAIIFIDVLIFCHQDSIMVVEMNVDLAGKITAHNILEDL